MLHTFCWAPYIFLFLEKARDSRPWLNGAWAGAFLGFCLLGGHPQIFYYVALAVAVHFFYCGVSIWSQDGPRAFVRTHLSVYVSLGLAALITALPQLVHMASQALGAIQLVHAKNVLHGAQRLLYTAHDSGEWGLWSYFLFPSLNKNHSESFFYVGILPLAAALAALVYSRHRAAGYWKAITLAGLVLLMGGNLGLHKVLVDVLPGYYNFRESVRWVFLVHLGLMVLAGFGLHWMLTQATKDELALVRLTTGSVIFFLLGLAVAGMAVGTALNIPFGDIGFGQPANSDWRSVADALVGAAFLLAAFWLAARRLGQGGNTRALRLFIVVVVALDLGFYPETFMEPNINNFGLDHSKVSAQASDRAQAWANLAHGPDGGRFLAPREALHQSALYRYQVPIVDPPGGYVDRVMPRGYWDTFNSVFNNPRLLDLLNVRFVDKGYARQFTHLQSHWDLNGYSQSAVALAPGSQVKRLALKTQVSLRGGTTPGEVLAYLGLARGGKTVASWPLRLGQELTPDGRWEVTLPQPLAADAVLLASNHPTTIVSIKEMWMNDLPLQDRAPLAQGEKQNRFAENPYALGLVHFTERAAVVKPDWEYHQVLQSIDTSRCLLLRQTPAGWKPPQGLQAGPGGQARLISSANQEVVAEVEAERPGYVTMSQSAYPGWRAWVDDKPAHILVGYEFIVAVPVPAGRHRVKFVYGEPLVKAALVVTPVGLLALLGWSLFAALRRRRQGLG